MTIPSPGQLVSVRQRQYVVVDVAENSLSPDPLETLEDAAPQHLLHLASVEDDGLGEELRVIWEVEPGTQVFDRASLPDPRRGFDDPDRLDAFLDAVRWGAIGGASVRHLHAPFQSGITLEDYQLDPVVRALRMPRVNLLVADDVGLGKTIEAGLVVQELLLRHRARTVLVVCPAGLQLQWRDQMRDKFGLEFRVVDSTSLKDLRRRRGIHVNPWNHFPRLITSIDFLKQDRILRRFREVVDGRPAFPRQFDLLIVDEAHNVAPSGRGAYAIDSLRTQAVREISRHFEHRLFLTATPHNGYTESFSALLELLDEQRFARGMPPDRAQLDAVMVRRLKTELPPDDLGSPRFPERRVVPIEVAYTKPELAAHQALRDYARVREAAAESDAERFATDFILKLLKKRLFSSPEAFRLTLEKHEATIRRAGGPARRVVRKPTLRLLRKEVDSAEEETADDELWEEVAGGVVETTSSVLRKLSDEEEALLEQLRTWAVKAAARVDSKAKALLAWLNETVRPGGEWNDERVIIFTEYRATQNWLLGLLSRHGFTGGDRLLTLYGGMPLDEREKIKAAFQASPSDAAVRILLATDAASEGIDLQNHCHRLVHYEIPWNPNRLEQRNGRVDRHGQTHSVLVHHFVGTGFQRDLLTPFENPGDLVGDLEFLVRAAIKVDQIREDLGNTGDVIATQVEEAMLGRRRRLDADTESSRARTARNALRFERKIRERIEQIRQQLDDSRADLHLGPEAVKHAVDIGLRLAGHPPLEPRRVPGPRGGRATAYDVPRLPGAWARCRDGLPHPHTGTLRPVVFDHDLAAGRDDIVLAHLGHPLAQMCLSLLRREVWQPEDLQKLHRVSARVVPSSAVDHPTVIGHARLVVLGADNERLHEEVITAGGVLREGRYRRLDRVGDVQAALEAARKGDPAPEVLRDRLAGTWEGHRDSLLGSLDARMRDRTDGLMSRLRRRAEEEADKLAANLRELRETILAELEKKPDQLEFWPDATSEERAQIESNRDALLERTKQIPEEIERERTRILARYESPVPRLFPVAVTYLVPERLAR